jgi:malonyl-CoA O-methyltransferase
MSKTYYDSIASGYNELHREEQEKKIQIIKRELDLESTNKDTLLLDVGCGPCFFQTNTTTIGIDPSIELLKQATTKTTRINAEAEHLPFKDTTFDYIISITAIQNFSDVEKGIKEIKRVTKSSGKFALTFLKNSQKKEFILKTIGKYFSIQKQIEEDKDIIVITDYQ